MAHLINQMNDTTTILLSLAVILLAGFLLTRLTKLAKLPNVTGYIIAGVIIGPSMLNLVPTHIINNMGFISDIALAFIAFGVGRFFKKEAFKETGGGVILITVMESVLAGIVVTLVMYFVFKLNWQFSLVLGAIATATAPASTMVTIRQYHARGNFVNTLLQVIAFDDAVCLILFSVATAIVGANAGEGVKLGEILVPLLFNLGALVIGFASGVLLSKLIVPKRSEDNRLILAISILFGLAGLCSTMNISPLLACMLFGATYINMTKDKTIFKQLERFSPPILSAFFVVSGMNLNLASFGTLGVVGVAYFVVRIIGKYMGAYLGSAVAGASREVRNYLGYALVPQAGVAIGLAFLGKRILGGEMGDMLLTIILSSSVLYELMGPASAKFALFKSGSITREKVPTEEKVSKNKSPITTH